MKKTPTLTERKRADIIDAALKEFREKGFRAMSMDALSARAGVSKRTVYNHFDNKEVLFKEVVRLLFDHFSEVVGISYATDRSLESQLKEFASSEMQLLKLDRFRDLSKIIVAECIYSPELAADALQQFSEQEQGLDAWIESAIKDGRLKKVEPSYASAQFLGIIKASAFWPQLLMGQPVPDESQSLQIIEDAVAMFLSHYEV